MLVILGIQHAMRMRRCYTVISGLSGSTIIFHIISLEARFSEWKVTEHKMCAFSVQILFETFLILKRIQRVIIKVYWFSREVPVMLVRF